MSSVSLSSLSSWYATPRIQAAAAWFLVAIVVAEAVVAIGLRDNDFLWHRDYGQNFLARKIQNNDHYPPARGLMDVPLAVAPYRVTRAIAFGAALLLLLACWRLWDRMATPAPATVARTAGFLAVLLILPYLLRDLDDCGLQIALLFMLSMAGYALSQKRPLQTGFWLATAVCYKATPLLCLPFLLWKRQWQAAAWTTVFLALWCAAPALYSGWDHNLHAHELWLAESARLKTAKEAYPSLVGCEPPSISNLSLYAGIARYLETYPPGHPLFIDHPWFTQFGDLPPVTAYYVLQGILALMGAIYFWSIRQPWGSQGDSDTMAGEWATLCALCALLSPLCWKQHLVLVLPCAYLQVRRALTSSLAAWARMIFLGAIAAIVYGCRPFVFGNTISAVLLSYKVDTLAVVILVTWTLFARRREVIAAVKTLPDTVRVFRKAA